MAPAQKKAPPAPKRKADAVKDDSHHDEGNRVLAKSQNGSTKKDDFEARLAKAKWVLEWSYAKLPELKKSQAEVSARAANNSFVLGKVKKFCTGDLQCRGSQALFLPLYRNALAARIEIRNEKEHIDSEVEKLERRIATIENAIKGATKPKLRRSPRLRGALPEYDGKRLAL